jgi:hypothetical protein
MFEELSSNLHLVNLAKTRNNFIMGIEGSFKWEEPATMGNNSR